MDDLMIVSGHDVSTADPERGQIGGPATIVDGGECRRQASTAI